MTRLSLYFFILALALPYGTWCQNQQASSTEAVESGPVTIGLLLPDRSHLDEVKAAELAIERANAKGGYMNRDFELVVRTAEGFWGAGSKESVSLVYEDHVRAIIGALDGRNGHLAEQVATKSHLPYIETFATEPTLSQAYIPWFFRVVPSDIQQSETILKQINKEGGGKIGILSAETYDTRYAVRSLTKAIAQDSGTPPLLIKLDTSTIHQRRVIEQILSSEVDHLVIPFDASYLRDLIISLGQVRPELKIYGTLHFAMGIEMQGSNWKDYEGVFMVRPHFDNDKHHELPDSHSAYMYDAVNLVVHAIRQVGMDRVSITDYISESDYSSAVTGSFSFDELGNRQGASTLIRIQHGRPQLVLHP